MKNKEFFETVKAMRETQKAYFKTRDKGLLIRSKELERQVDEEISNRKRDTVNVWGPITPNVEKLIEKVNTWEPHGGEGL